MASGPFPQISFRSFTLRIYQFNEGMTFMFLLKRELSPLSSPEIEKNKYPSLNCAASVVTTRVATGLLLGQQTVPQRPRHNSALHLPPFMSHGFSHCHSSLFWPLSGVHLFLDTENGYKGRTRKKTKPRLSPKWCFHSIRQTFGRSSTHA